MWDSNPGVGYIIPVCHRARSEDNAGVASQRRSSEVSISVRESEVLATLGERLSNAEIAHGCSSLSARSRAMFRRCAQAAGR
jgi:hypothetical protein